MKVCTAALRLLLQILNWDFRYHAGGTKANLNVFSAMIRSDSASKRAECILVQVKKFSLAFRSAATFELVYTKVGRMHANLITFNKCSSVDDENLFLLIGFTESHTKDTYQNYIIFITSLLFLILGLTV